MILYPIGCSYNDHAKNEEEYRQVAENMAQIIHDSDEEGVTYRPMKSSDLYPASGSSEDFQYANNILGFTVELARSFAPDEEDIMPINKGHTLVVPKEHYETILDLPDDLLNELIKVTKKDTKNIIGKDGKTIKAIRSLVSMASINKGIKKKIPIEITDS